MRLCRIEKRPARLCLVDSGYTGPEPAAATAEHCIKLAVVKLAEAKRGFVLLPRRWVVERSFAWLARFRRLSRDYERLPSTFAGLHWLAFSSLLLSNLFKTLVLSPGHRLVILRQVESGGWKRA